jgi:hypothetical protein
VAGIDHAAKLRVVVEERVPLVEQQRRMKRIDRAVERRGGDVAGWEGAARERADDLDQPRLPAPLRPARDERSGRMSTAVSQ